MRSTVTDKKNEKCLKKKNEKCLKKKNEKCLKKKRSVWKKWEIFDKKREVDKEKWEVTK